MLLLYFIDRKLLVNIILNGQTLQYPLTGIGWYTWYLLQGLQTHPLINRLVCIPAAKLDNSYKLANKFGLLNFKKIIKSLPGSYIVLNSCRDSLFRKKSQLFHNRNFIYHEPAYIIRPYAGPTVCTVHDLSHICYPEYHPKKRVKFLLRYLPKSIEKADHIIAVSDFTRKAVINTFKIPPEKITSIYHGISNLYRPRQFDEIKTVLSRLGLLGKNYLLCVGTLEPRKNLERLILGYSQLSEQQRNHHPLVLVGVKGWNHSRLEQLIKPFLQKNQLHYLGYVSEVDLAYLYSGAFAFVYLSIYEGFGFPLLEAMASGVPTLTANGSSLLEIVGNAALLANPFDIDEIAEKLYQLLGNEELRAKLKHLGLRQAAKFSWKTCIENVISVYQKLENN